MDEILKTVLPTIANALLPGAGAVVGIAENWLAGKLGVPADKVQETLAGMKPEDIIKMKELDNEFKEYCLENGIKLDLAQIEVNLQEAKSERIFVAGWRPFIGWICGTGIGYHFLLRPIFNGLVAIFGGSAEFPALEIQDLIALVVTMLGSASLRSYDKKNGTGNGA